MIRMVECALLVFCANASLLSPLTAEAIILFEMNGSISCKTASTWYGLIAKV